MWHFMDEILTSARDVFKHSIVYRDMKSENLGFDVRGE